MPLLYITATDIVLARLAAKALREINQDTLPIQAREIKEYLQTAKEKDATDT
jgi:hypothetical protein